MNKAILNLKETSSKISARGRREVIIYIYIYIYIFFFLIFIYLFLAVLGLHFCVRAFSSCGERGPLFIVVRGPLTVTASLVAEHRLQTCRLSNCGSWAQLLRGMWDLPRPGLEPMSPCIGRQILNHCATREAREVIILTEVLFF